MERTDIEALLPAVFRRAVDSSPALAGLLDVMASLGAPAETVLAHIDAYFDPRRAPDAWVPFLARWVGIDFEVQTGLGHLRELVAVAVALSQKRGTAAGLTRFLETATGIAGFGVDERVADDSGRVRPFHIRVLAPAIARAHRGMIEQIIAREKPAYVTHELVFGDAPPPGG